MAGGPEESGRGAVGEPAPLRPASEDDAPRRAPSVGWRPADDGAVLYDGAPLGLHQLNGSAGLVWQLLDPEIPLRTLVDELAEASGASRAQVHDDVLGIVDALRLRDLVLLQDDVDPSPEPAAAEPDAPSPDDGGEDGSEDVQEPRYLGVPPNV